LKKARRGEELYSLTYRPYFLERAGDERLNKESKPENPGRRYEKE